MAQLRSVTEIAPKSPFLYVNRSPTRYGSRANAKAILYSVNTIRYWLSTFEIGEAQFRSVTEIAPKSPFLCVYRSPIRYGLVPAQKLSGIVWTPIRYVTLHFRDRRGPVSLRYWNHPEITVLMCEQKPYPVWFGANTTAILHSENRAWETCVLLRCKLIIFIFISLKCSELVNKSTL